MTKNETFEKEYGMSLEEAYSEISEGKMKVAEVIESDEFADYLVNDLEMTWNELQEEYDKSDKYQRTIIEYMGMGFTKEEAKYAYIHMNDRFI